MRRPGAWICCIFMTVICSVIFVFHLCFHYITERNRCHSLLLNMTRPSFCQQQFFYSLHHSKTKFLVQSIHKTRPKSLLWAPHVYHCLRMHHDWPVKSPIVDLPIRLRGNLKSKSSNSLSSLGAQSNDIGAACRCSYRQGQIMSAMQTKKLTLLNL